MTEIKSIQLNATKVAARVRREEKTAAFTAEQRARTILRDRAVQRASQTQRTRLS